MTVNQERALAALIANPNRKEAAKAAGLSERCRGISLVAWECFTYAVYIPADRCADYFPRAGRSG